MARKITSLRLAGMNGVLALGAAASTVSAQSREWQRGYEQGFRDGVASVQGGAAPPMRPPPPGWQTGRLVIQDAQFGVRNNTCNARPAVQSIVDRHGPNRVYASTQLCGDPAPNRPKTLWVTFSCDNRRPVSVSAPEGRWLNLDC